MKACAKRFSEVMKKRKGEYFNMIITLDRIEENICVFVSDDDEMLALTRDALGGIEVKEGDVLDFTDGVFTPLPRESEKRTEEAKKRLDALFTKGEKDKEE